jgi:cobalt-zinc-cadmium efflux system membrane fusion protein
VHVEHRDKNSAVLASDGAIFPGEVIAANGAFQVHLAIKNQSGGAIDPHAGHHH